MSVVRFRFILLFGTFAVLLGGLGLVGSTVRITRADLQGGGNDPARGVGGAVADGRDADAPACQVTVIALLVSPGGSREDLDPRLSRIKNQLRQLIPEDHAVKLLDVRTDRLSAAQSITCDLADQRTARVTLTASPGADGKVRLHFELTQRGARLSASDVATPLNQLFFCDHALGDDSRIVIGIGAR